MLFSRRCYELHIFLRGNVKSLGSSCRWICQNVGWYFVSFEMVTKDRCSDTIFTTSLRGSIPAFQAEGARHL